MAGGGAMADAFISLGDKLHNNFNSTMNILANRRQGDQKLALERDQFEMDKQRQAIENMINQQKLMAMQGQNKWMADFRRGMARG